MVLLAGADAAGAAVTREVILIDVLASLVGHSLDFRSMA